MMRGACLVALLAACGSGNVGGVIPCGDGGTCPPGLRCENGICLCRFELESCDGVDNDCDGEVDEVGPDGLIDVGGACVPEGAGDCTQGVLACVDGALVCEPTAAPEACNGSDDDCDGVVDDGLDPATCPCAPGGGGPSAEVCNQIDDDCTGTADDGLDPAICPCAPGGAGATAEICNGVDDDCDGVTDDETSACGGLAGCACAPGGPGPSPEVCNGVDDDCNDLVDDGILGCGCADCGLASAEVCNQVDDDCNGAADDGLDPVACPCAPGGVGATAEICNGVDDDCDGVIDDGLTACACAPGGPGPGPEVCNGIDDDCDGVVDDGLTACACAPGSPGPGPEVCNEIDDDCDDAIDEINSVTGAPCAQFGEPCTTNGDCSSQLCVGDTYDRYCSVECDVIGDPGDCPIGYRCWDNPSPSGADYCRRNYAGCSSDADCAAGEVCAITCNDAVDTAITECRPAIPGGAPATSACTSNADCATYHCFRTGVCSEVCGEDADCGPGYRCVYLYTSQCGGDYVPRCLDACDCDTECPVGQLCQPYLHQVVPPDTQTAVGACDLPSPGGGPGADCDHSASPPVTCSHSICSNGGTGYCTQICSATCGCPFPIGPCTSSFLTFGGGLGTHPAMTCDTP